jgi:hypothetical protein
MSGRRPVPPFASHSSRSFRTARRSAQRAGDPRDRKGESMRSRLAVLIGLAGASFLTAS